jgi:hypothetical protein
MSALEQAVGGPAIEVVAKATRRRFTVEYKRKIVREADGCKTPGTVGRCCDGRGCTLPSNDVEPPEIPSDRGGSQTRGNSQRCP